ncbi:amine oxidase [Cristinia sonorae]|uniref:Amine oxidase n=1 Tax=Cristinia sonorae TaxID=1940300 RepID=A0A8K0XMV6_9AGAR|nr:amine oxidase [Cristinia sonorae]
MLNMISRNIAGSSFLRLLVLFTTLSFVIALPAQIPLSASRPPKNATVLILGGGVAGIAAAQALYENGVSDVIVVEARHELGGRMMSRSFGSVDKQYTVEVGANWIQGTQAKGGSENPIWTLGRKHGIETRKSSFFNITTFDETGAVDFRDAIAGAATNYARLTDAAGVRVSHSLVDATARGGYALTGSQPSNRYEMASEYFQFDWEYAQTPEETSWIASSWVMSPPPPPSFCLDLLPGSGMSWFFPPILYLPNLTGMMLLPLQANNHTFRPDAGGFSDVNAMSVDQRGFKTLIQREAEVVFKADRPGFRALLNTTVVEIEYANDGVRVHLQDGGVLSANYAICTFSLGVLQHNDVTFKPRLPAWKREAIHSMSMGVFTKIFLQFPTKFWFDTEMGLYADRERGRYTVWQSLDHENYFPGSGLLFVTVTGDFSKRIESLPNDQVLAEVLTVLSNMYPNTTIPQPLDFYFHRWHADPLFRGSYSNWPASFLVEHLMNLRADVGRRLWFAGEATSRRHFGFLHGAWFEGRDVGKSVAKCVRNEECGGLEYVETVKNVRPYT